MASSPSPLRFVDTWMARTSVFILALIALLAMAIPDNLAYSQAPLLLGLVMVVFFILWGLIRGAKLPSISGLAWMSLLSGGYFFWRASTSCAVLEGFTDMGLILACMVFYVMGYIFAQSPRAGWWMSFFMVIALMLNALYFVLMRIPDLDLSLNFLGRTDVGLSGTHGRHSAFFLYKNVASFFFAVGGAFVLYRQFWLGRFSFKSLLLSLFGLSMMGLSFFCDSRVCYIILPLALWLGWLLSLALRLYSERSLRCWDIMLLLLSLVFISALAFEWVFGHQLHSMIAGVDTHLRFMIWGDIFQILPDAPLIGNGAGASQWEIVPIFNEWVTPNYAHNEYLQLWADYGIVGLGLALFIILSHLMRAYLLLSTENVLESRRVLLLGAVFILLLISCYALLDFPWHQFALLSLSAFCCGIMLSPVSGQLNFLELMGRSSAVFSEKKKALKALGTKGRLFLMLLLLTIAGLLSFLFVKHAPVLKAQWEYDFALKDASYTESMRQTILKDAFELYPESNIVFQCMLRSGLLLGVNIDEYEAMMRKSLEYNSKQLFARVALSELMEINGKHEAVESMLRDAYSGDGMSASRLSWWPTYYGYNLLVWAVKIKAKGEFEKAFSMMDHALSMHAHTPLHINTTWRGVAKPWNEGMQRPGLRELLQLTKNDVAFYRMIGVKKDDSWKDAMREGGKTALYSWSVKLGVKRLLEEERARLVQSERRAKWQAIIWKREQAAAKKVAEEKARLEANKKK